MEPAQNQVPWWISWRMCSRQAAKRMRRHFSSRYSSRHDLSSLDRFCHQHCEQLVADEPIETRTVPGIVAPPNGRIYARNRAHSVQSSARGIARIKNSRPYLAPNCGRNPIRAFQRSSGRMPKRCTRSIWPSRHCQECQLEFNARPT